MAAMVDEDDLAEAATARTTAVIASMSGRPGVYSTSAPTSAKATSRRMVSSIS
jgi:hypothetical protein